MGFTFDHVWQAVLTVGGIVLGWLEYARREELKAMKTAIADAAKKADDAKQSATLIAFEAGKALAEHKLYAAETFPRRGDVERALEKVEERLAERLAEHQEAQLSRLEEIRDRLPRRS